MPLLSVRSDTNDIVESTNSLFDLNMHPPKDQLNNIIIDLINHYNWSSVIIIYQEPDRIIDLVNYSNEYYEHRIRFQFQLFENDISTWPNLIKDIKTSGSQHIVIDLETSFIDYFLKIVNIVFKKYALKLRNLKKFMQL